MARETAAQKRKREAEEAEAAKAAAEAAPVEAEAVEADQPPNGVFIEKSVGPEGNISVNVAPVGTVQVTEVQTLMEIGLKTFRDQIGLGSPAGR